MTGPANIATAQQDTTDPDYKENGALVSDGSRSRSSSQDDLDAPHLVSLKKAISDLDASAIENLGKKLLWTADTIVDSQKFRTPIHGLVLAYATSCENLAGWESRIESLTQKFSECLSIFLEQGVDINERDVIRNTPLHLLCQHSGVSDVIKVMVASGAKVNKENVHMQTPLHLAIDNGTIKETEALLDAGADPNVFDCSGLGPLHYAVRYRRSNDLIKALTGCGASFDLQKLDGRGHSTGPSPLHVAVHSDRKELVQLLLDLGAQAEVTDSSGQTPLHLAASYDITGEMVYMLIQHGASLNAKDTIYGENALHKAIKRNMVDNVKHLVTAGISLSAPDLYGESPLHTAATCCRNMEIWVALMNASDVDTRIRNAKGQTPLDRAARGSNKLALNVLKQVNG